MGFLCLFFFIANFFSVVIMGLGIGVRGFVLREKISQNI